MLPYFDAHCDTLSRLAYTGESIQTSAGHISLPQMDAFSGFAQVFAIFYDAGAKASCNCITRGASLAQQRASGVACDLDGAAAAYAKQRDLLYAICADFSNEMRLCTTEEEIELTWADGWRAAVLAVEGAELLSHTTLADAYRDGVRIVTLTWNYRNAVGGSNKTGGGLTEFGRAFVREANELGVLLDLSHASDALFWDTLEASRRPIFASHSNARALCPHPRNLTDEQFQALVQCGGAAGLNLYAEFLSEGACTIDTVLSHIEHFFALGGEDHVTLGTDFDGCDRLPAGVDRLTDMTKLADALARAGYTDMQIHKLFYQNLLRVFGAATTPIKEGA